MRFVQIMLPAAVATVPLILSVSPSIGAGLSQNNGAPVMTQTVAGHEDQPCSSALEGGTGSTCSSINLYGGGAPLQPRGPARTTTVRISNVGNHAAHEFALVAGPCTSAPVPTAPVHGDGNLCDALHVKVSVGSAHAVAYDGTAAALAQAPVDLLIGGPSEVAPGSSRDLTCEVWLDRDADMSKYQALVVDQSITLQFGA